MLSTSGSLYWLPSTARGSFSNGGWEMHWPMAITICHQESLKRYVPSAEWQYFLHSLIQNRTAKFCIVFILLECVHVCVTGVQVGVLVFTHPEVIWHVQFKCPVVILYFSASSIVLNERASHCRTGSLQWSSHFSDFLLHPLNTVLRTCQTTSQMRVKRKKDSSDDSGRGRTLIRTAWGVCTSLAL